MKQSQKLLLTWLIEDTGLFKKINGYISENDFTEDLYHRVAVMVFTQFKTDGAVNPAKIVSMFRMKRNSVRLQVFLMLLSTKLREK